MFRCLGNPSWKVPTSLVDLEQQKFGTLERFARNRCFFHGLHHLFATGSAEHAFEESWSNGEGQYSRSPPKNSWQEIGVSKNMGTPKSSISIGFSLINHPFRGTTIFGNTQMVGTVKTAVDLNACCGSREGGLALLAPRGGSFTFGEAVRLGSTGRSTWTWERGIRTEAWFRAILLLEVRSFLTQMLHGTGIIYCMWNVGKYTIHGFYGSPCGQAGLKANGSVNTSLQSKGKANFTFCNIIGRKTNPPNLRWLNLNMEIDSLERCFFTVQLFFS